MVSVDMDVGSGRTTETLGLVCLFRRGLMFLFLVMILLSPAAQENLTPEAHRPEAGVALLARGPFTAKGLPFISTNVISYRGGIYLFDKGEVTIFFPDREVLLSDAWANASCPMAGALLHEGDVGRTYLLDTAEGQTFFLFRDCDEKLECSFMRTFLTRFAYFSSVSRDPGRLQLPAVVDFGG
ncbi:hypothetical protein [Sediminispirochaeta smaragdinae]|uniref:Uncharacterized protein n=1 Tax=Sediminispirochaeta smaragdinae (strain DSM 11293 / JCM 15392 / SEBR 4228) TaxID=573413 RepID=E1R7T4_SEDSS|nr:hypothetical protein [Sediminispirochaeta smaragdinae]ADK82789.1 hypothetical protein Spirs_3703 [Sediminispirochaeta smaragdinae DSM 11293]